MDEIRVDPVQKELKASIIKVSSYDNKVLRGTFFNPYYSEARRFDNLMQLLLIMEELQNELNYPERAVEMRSFRAQDGGGAELFWAKGGGRAEEAAATFRVSILFRQNASWQGNVIWLEKNLSSRFRSALELILLIDSVLS